jgi:poly(A) polymerase
MSQNSKHHDLNWAEHTKALARGVARKYRDKDPDKVLLVMMSAMLHDVGKLDEAGRQPKDDGTTSYHGHEDVSKDITSEFMKFVKLDQYASPVSALVGEHMRPHQLTRYDSNPAALRRFIRQMSELGIEWDDVVNLAAADSMAKGRPAEDQKAGYEKLLTDGAEFIKNMPVSKGRGVKPVINGQELMLELGLKEGPFVGEALKKVREMMDANPAITKEEVVAQLRVDMAGRRGEASLVKELWNDNKFRIFKIAKADNVC